MQLRCLHANSFSFEVQDHDPGTDHSAGKDSVSLGNCLVVFVAVDRRDTGRTRTVASAGAERIDEVADQLKETAVAVVPCRQLTDRPASRPEAAEMIELFVELLGAETRTVPLGHPVAFTLDARGHPFANQQFTIDPERRPAGEWLLLADGEIDPVETGALDDTRRSLLEDGRLIPETPGEQLFEPAESGPAMFTGAGTVLPDGVLLRTLVDSFVTRQFSEYGAVPLERSPVSTGDGSGLAGLDIQNAELPFSIWESARGSYRDEGENAGPVLGTVVAGTDAALEKAGQQAELLSELLDEFSLGFEPVIHATGPFIDQHRDWLENVAGVFDSDRSDHDDREVLLERRHPTDCDWLSKLTFAVVGPNGTRDASPAVRIESAPEAAGKGAKKAGSGTDERPLFVRSTVGDPLRVVATICRTEAESEHPQLPTWLSPVQCRLIPIDSAAIETCETLATEIEAAGIRIDIDDRERPVSERLRTADDEWIPYDAVVGSEDGEPLDVTVRAERSEREFTVESLVDRINSECAAYPRHPLFASRRYSDRSRLR